MKQEQKRLGRFRRLMQIDQRQLDLAIEELRAANSRLDKQLLEVGKLQAERDAELAEKHEHNIALQSRRASWLDWSLAELTRAKSMLAERKSERSECQAVMQRWSMRVKAWEKLTERLLGRIRKLELKAESNMSDELATFQKRPFLLQGLRPTFNAAQTEGTSR